MKTASLRTLLTLVVSCCVFLSPLFSSSATADMRAKNESYAIGTSTISKGNLVQAKNSAIRDALTKGVETYLLRLLGSQDFVTHFESLVHQILPTMDQAVENFHILAEEQAGDRYFVFVRIRTNENRIEERLKESGIFQAARKSIKVLFMVSEIRGPVEVFWWENAKSNPALTPIELVLHGVFQDRGFSPVNRISDLPSSDFLSEQFSATLKPQEAMQWGRLFSANVVVFGKSSLLDNKLVLNLKAVDVQTGVQICEKSGVQDFAPGTVDNEKLLDLMRKCVSRLASEICPCILKDIHAEPQTAHELDVTLAGITQPRQFQTFSEFLKTHVPGIKRIIPSRITDNSMSATVYYQGDRITFISEVLSNQNLPFPLHLGQTDTENILFYLD